MTDYTLIKLRAQLSILRDVQRQYSGRTIENIITNLESRITAIEKYENN